MIKQSLNNNKRMRIPVSLSAILTVIKYKSKYQKKNKELEGSKPTFVNSSVCFIAVM